MNDPIRVISDGPSLPRDVVGLNGPKRGVVAFDVPAAASSYTAVAQVFFEALGQTAMTKPNRVVGTRHHLPLLTVSLMSWEITDVIVDNAQRCGISALTQLIHTALSADCILNLVLRSRPPRVDAVLAAWPHHNERWSALSERLQRRSDPAPPPQNPSRFPEVPAAEFPWFLRACRQHLDPPSYTLVETEHRRVLASIRGQIGSCGAPGDALSALRRELRDATNAAHALTACRATAAAAFPTGVLVTADATQLAAAIVNEPYFEARNHPDWSDLHTYRRPERAAVAVLAALGMTAAEIAAITVGEIADVVSDVALDARVHLRRQLLLRDVLGAGTDQPFVTLADGSAMNTRWIRESLLETGRLTGVPADRRPKRPARETEYQWAAALGIRARKFT